MDWITQGLIGGACAGSGARRKEMRTAIGIGAFSGMLADLDVLIRSADDPLLVLEYHRHFSHSLVFVPVGALIAAALAWLLLRSRLSFGRIYLYALLGYLPSGLLDAFTSYGTHLLWPFTDERIAWNAVSVVDPVFSAILLTGLLVAALRRHATPARIGLALAVVYLGGGVLQRERAEAIATTVAAGRGHPVDRLEAKPTFGNLLLWRTVYQSGSTFHVDAVRIPPWGDHQLYAGGRVARVEPSDVTAVPPNSIAARDMQRFEFFSDGWLARHPDDPWVIGDLRYAIVPTDVRPLWGIRIDPARPDRHVEFRTFRNMSADDREKFLAMLKGKTATSGVGR